MYHSISFGGINGTRINTWDRWKLVPNKPPVVNPPSIETKYIDVPYGSRLDLTEVLVKQIPYKNRTGSWEFTLTDRRANWVNVYTDILENTHGRDLRVVLDDDPTYYYTGRLKVDKRDFGDLYSQLTISYDFEPYKYLVNSSGSHDWLWNDLFSNIIYYGIFDVSGTAARNLINPSGSSITPKFTCSSAMTVTKGGSTYSLPAGTTTSPGFSLSPGDNQMTFTGTGRVEVDYSLGNKEL